MTDDASRRARRLLMALVLVSPASLEPPARAALPSMSPARWQSPASDARALAAARAMMHRVRYCAFITQGASGEASARTVDPLPPDSAFVVRFATNPRSRKLREIARDPRVTLYYFDVTTQGYVSLHGRARVIRDIREKGRHWKDDWAPHYPDRARDMALVEVTPTRLEVVSISEGITGDPGTWAAPTVRFPVRAGRMP